MSGSGLDDSRLSGTAPLAVNWDAIQGDQPEAQDLSSGPSLKRLKSQGGPSAGYSPPNQNHLPRNHVIGSRARYEIQMLDSAFHGYGQGKQAKEESQNIFGFFKRERRPSDKHKEFVDMLQFPKGNK